LDTLAQLNERIAAVDIAEDVRRIEGRARTVGADFATEAPLPAAMPDEVFEPGRMLTPRVDRYGCVTVRQCYYSVPARLIGKQVRVLLRASEVVIFDGRVEVARHVRAITKWIRTMLLDHYLEVLLRKPGALPGATALVQARVTAWPCPGRTVDQLETSHAGSTGPTGRDRGHPPGRGDDRRSRADGTGPRIRARPPGGRRPRG
jgi:hypothetical protein